MMFLTAEFAIIAEFLGMAKWNRVRMCNTYAAHFPVNWAHTHTSGTLVLQGQDLPAMRNLHTAGGTDFPYDPNPSSALRGSPRTSVH